MITTTVQNYGILASISWNSRSWADNPTLDDLKSSKYDFVKYNAHMHESLNFGHNKFPAEDDGFFIGYTPMFNRPPSVEKSKNVSIVFFISSDYKNSNRKTIIGFYGSPVFGGTYKRTKRHPSYKIYNSGNIKAHFEDIVYFDNPIVINNEFAQEKKLLPIGKKISQQGFNYLNSDNVYNIISLALKLNPTSKKLKSLVKRLPLLSYVAKQQATFDDFYEIAEGCDVDTVKGICELEMKMKNKKPEIKQRVSSYIERGAIANRIKSLTGGKCLVCEALGQPVFSFFKSNGDYYVETHHVEQVSTIKMGVLSITNLITVCANHHRQLHYGKVTLINQTDKYFIFQIDEKEVQVKKIVVK